MGIFSLFVSIDIETTGLDPSKCDIVEIGAVIDDWLTPLDDPPTFHTYVKQDMYRGEPYALSMHPKIFRRIATEEEGWAYMYPGEAVEQLGLWMTANGAYDTTHGKHRAVVAGKNFANFDDKFLRQLPKFDERVRYLHRVLDPAMLYWNPVTDEKPPNTKTCMERAGLTGEVAHTALEDAFVVTKLIQVAVGRKASTLDMIRIHKERDLPIPDWLDCGIDPMIGGGTSER
ncbi:MAG: exonuclease domain-containing protein [Candidatus Thorarchaeota archaeon]|jgi:DNA polymerase III epsilon subunit-like protein